MSDDAVHAQYEALPYPERNPADEKDRLIIGSPSHLLELNHYVFGGRRDFSKPFRALVAGGGTGDAAIMLAQQLADFGAAGEVVYTDISSASREVAETRAMVRGLQNLSFQSLPIEELAVDGIGRFDYIDCCGVLHHLADPAAGLKSLTQLLADEGGMGLMLYGELGRTGVYHVQEMLRLLDGGENHGDRLAMARRLLSTLPETNWFQRNAGVRDHFEGGAAGLYDLLLHPRDRAYLVPEVVELLDGAGLSLTGLIEPASYDPASYTKDAELLARCGDLAPIERAAFAELLAGNIRTHVFYAVPTKAAADAVTQVTMEAVPVFHNLEGAAFAGAFRPGTAMTADLDGLKISRALPGLSGEFAARIDGQTSIGDITKAVGDQRGAMTADQIWNEFNQFYSALNALGRLFLIDPHR